MIGAAQPVADDATNYAAVAAHRQSNGEHRPTELATDVHIRYSRYVERIADPAGPLPDSSIAASDQTMLRDNAKYLSLVHFNPLKKEILGSVRAGKCAYCYQFACN